MVLELKERVVEAERRLASLPRQCSPFLLAAQPKSPDLSLNSNDNIARGDNLFRTALARAIIAPKCGEKRSA
jgi:hypothetical protein